MKALILAAGEGTRLRPLTLTRPKPMVPIEGRPLLEYLVDLLRQHGVTEIAINLHYRPEAIVEHFGDGSRFGVSITYSPEERLLGSAGAARQLAPFLTEPFFVLYGDVLTDIDLTALAALHVANDAAATMALYEVPDPSRCGIAELDETGRILRFVEKPPPEECFSNLANTGICVFDPTVLDLIPDGQPSDFGHDLFPTLIRNGFAVYGLPTDAYVLDIGSAERYEQVQADVRAGRLRARPTTTRRDP